MKTYNCDCTWRCNNFVADKTTDYNKKIMIKITKAKRQQQQKKTINK